jgi:hypothetical protein
VQAQPVKVLSKIYKYIIPVSAETSYSAVLQQLLMGKIKIVAEVSRPRRIKKNIFPFIERTLHY